MSNRNEMEEMPNLQIRRIYKSSKTSCAITLPSGWMRYFKLQPGDEVEVISNGTLKIRPLRRETASCPLEGNKKLKMANSPNISFNGEFNESYMTPACNKIKT